MDWLRLYEGLPKLGLLEKPCKDCAVVWNFYKEYSDLLKKEKKELQEFVSHRWFCHNNRSKSCRGNINNLCGIKKKKKK